MVNLPLSALIAAGLLVLVCGYVWGLSAVYYIWYDFVRVKIMKKPSHAMQPDELIWILLGFASGWLGLGLIILGIVIRVAGSDKWVWWLPLVVMGAACFYPYFEWPWKRYGDLMVIGAACWLGLWGKFTFDWYGPMDPPVEIYTWVGFALLTIGFFLWVIPREVNYRGKSRWLGSKR